MFISYFQGAAASTDSVADLSFASLPAANLPAIIPSATDPGTPPPTGPDSRNPNDYETVRHMLFGSLSVVRFTIRLLHKCGYAEPNDWSQPISTGRANEVMAILTKRVML
ncbi:MAG: hypothetical protein WBG63_11085 [Phormidesmis sp.]